MGLLSLRLVGAVGARTYLRSSYSQRGPTVAWIRTQVLAVASPLLTTELSRNPKLKLFTNIHPHLWVCGFSSLSYCFVVKELKRGRIARIGVAGYLVTMVSLYSQTLPPVGESFAAPQWISCSEKWILKWAPSLPQVPLGFLRKAQILVAVQINRMVT